MANAQTAKDRTVWTVTAEKWPYATGEPGLFAIYPRYSFILAIAINAQIILHNLVLIY